MKKILSAVAISAILSTTGAVAGDYYGGVGVGYEDIGLSLYDPGVTLVANGGKSIMKLGVGTLGAEGEFTYTVVPLSYGSSYFGDNELTIMTIGAYATYTFDHSDKFYSRVKAGIANRSYSWDNDSGFNSDYNEIGLALGAGLGYKLSDSMRTYADLILLDASDLKQLNFGVQMNF